MIGPPKKGLNGPVLLLRKRLLPGLVVSHVGEGAG